jgi:hypothetical protein
MHTEIWGRTRFSDRWNRSCRSEARGSNAVLFYLFHARQIVKKQYIVLALNPGTLISQQSAISEWSWLIPRPLTEWRRGWTCIPITLIEDGETCIHSPSILFTHKYSSLIRKSHLVNLYDGLWRLAVLCSLASHLRIQLASCTPISTATVLRCYQLPYRWSRHL